MVLPPGYAVELVSSWTDSAGGAPGTPRAVDGHLPVSREAGALRTAGARGAGQAPEERDLREHGIVESNRQVVASPARVREIVGLGAAPVTRSEQRSPAIGMPWRPSTLRNRRT